MLYQLHGYGFDPEVEEPQYFQEVYTSLNSMVRIYKVKDVDAASREYADAYHAYPPALDDLLSRKTDFKQILRL